MMNDNEKQQESGRNSMTASDMIQKLIRLSETIGYLTHELEHVSDSEVKKVLRHAINVKKSEVDLLKDNIQGLITS